MAIDWINVTEVVNALQRGFRYMSPNYTSKYKYKEDQMIKQINDYIESTYSEHYFGKNGLQVFDLWEALDDDPAPIHRNMAIKYLYRYGKKAGFNKKDLFKTIHYCLMLLYYHDKLKRDEVKKESTDDNHSNSEQGSAPSG